MAKKFKFYFLWMSLICTAAFVLQTLIPGFTELFILNEKALHGEYWRFVSAIFLHGSLIHLIYNLFALLFFGLSLEKLAGSRRFLMVFLGSGIIANFISVSFYPASLGASGGIYGIIGSLTVLKPFMVTFAFGIIMPIFIAAILWIIGDLIEIFVPSNIGNLAHLSGIAIGFFLGFLFRALNKKKSRKVIRKKIIFPEDYIKEWENKYLKR